jgi:hypothetical protein
MQHFTCNGVTLASRGISLRKQYVPVLKMVLRLVGLIEPHRHILRGIHTEKLRSRYPSVLVCLMVVYSCTEIGSVLVTVIRGMEEKVLVNRLLVIVLSYGVNDIIYQSEIQPPCNIL